MTFLKKIIRLTQMMSGCLIAVKPEKIVAGLEPEVIFLQIIEYERAASRSIQNIDKWQKRRCFCEKNLECVDFGFRERS